MTNEQVLAVALHEKMERELSAWREDAAKANSEDIINGFIPYELVYKDDLLSSFSMPGLINIKEADYRFLLNLEQPLDWLYVQWLGAEDNHISMLEEFVENTLAYRRKSVNNSVSIN